MKVEDMIRMTREVTDLFDEEVGKWEIPVMVTELVGEVGTLADTIMMKERYRPLREGDHIDLEDDIVDVMFMLIRIADHYEIDLESAYKTMIERTHQKLESRQHVR